MEWIEALLMGLLQGFTEFLPVSSSGHLTIMSNIFGLDGEENLTFTIVVHVATVLSTLCMLWKEVANLLKGVLKFKMNDEMVYFLKICISMIPIGIVGVFFKDYVESIFGSGLLIVGLMLLLTATLLTFTYYYKPKNVRDITYRDAFIIGLSQACAVMPGLSRSGTTIATGMLIGNKKEHLSQFSFLMVIPPILGEALLDGKKILEGAAEMTSDVSLMALLIGFVSAFVAGCIACKWMINVVKKGKLVYFGIYCALAGALAIAYHFAA